MNLLTSRSIAACAVILAGALTLAGCSAPASPTSTNAPVTQAPMTPSSSPSPSTRADGATVVDEGPDFHPVRADGTKPFGAYFMYDRYAQDGSVATVFDYSKNLMIKVTRLGHFTPGQYASISDGKADTYTKYRVTLINNTKDAVPLTGVAQVTAQDGDEEAAQVFDGKVGSSPDGTLLSGRTASWLVGFGDDHPGQVVTATLYVDHYQYAPAVFTE